MQTDEQLSIRVMLMPKDTNSVGTIFGGVILSNIDLAGGVEARRHTRHRVVTIAMREVVFHQPVYVGDIVSFYTRLIGKGRTSMTIRINVEAQRAGDPTQVVKVTEAEAVFVAIDEQGKPVGIEDQGCPPL